MPLRITSKKAGFRRCGVEHPATPTTYPDGRFTAEEVERLKAEPMLVVEEIEAKIGKGGKGGKGKPKEPPEPNTPPMETEGDESDKEQDKQ